MKNWMTVLSLFTLSISAYAGNIDNKNLISNMNFGMEALTVTNVENKVEITIEDAILNYADNQPMLDKKLNKKIKEIFGLNDFNAIRITFSADDCQQNDKQTDVFECSKNITSQSTVTIQALKLGHNNVVLKESSVIIQDNNVQVSTMMIKETDTRNTEYTTLRAVVEIDSLQMNNVKSYLSR